MDIDEAMRFIGSFSRSGTPVRDLDRAMDLMEKTGHPEKKLKFIHVAGTNGKGSAVEFISNALIYSGYRTGQFTSPFILRFSDRIRINGIEIDEKSLCEITEYVRSEITGTEYSRFEITMAVAFLYFVKEKCDIAVIETGIGGLLDCTNVIPPPVLSVITSVGLDHTGLLGDTLDKIAAQKAGIIKENSAVVLSPDNARITLEIVSGQAHRKHAELIIPDISRLDVSDSPSEQDNCFRYKDTEYHLAMLGEGQICNAVTAIESCRFIRKKGFDIPEENIKKSVRTSRLKARIQLISGDPPVIVDGGHNPDGIRNLVCALKKLPYDHIAAVVGMVDTKDWKSALVRLPEICDIIFTVDDFAANAVSGQLLAEYAAGSARSEACVSLEDAVYKAKKYASEKNGAVLVCGSLYLASAYLNKYEN